MKHYILIVPGLGDHLLMTNLSTKFWKIDDGKLEIWLANWKNDAEGFDSKYARLLKKITQLQKKADHISLIGISAGASLVGNVYIQNPRLINKVVNICGRLRMKKTGVPTIERV